MKQQQKNARLLELLIHLIGWGLMFSFPFFFMNKQETNTINWIDYLRHSMVPISFFVVFYVNYFYLIPHYFFRQQLKRFIIINIIFVSAVSFGLHFWQQINFPPKPIYSSESLYRPQMPDSIKVSTTTSSIPKPGYATQSAPTSALPASPGQSVQMPPMPPDPHMEEIKGNFHHKKIFFLRDFFSLILTVGLCVSIRVSYRWTDMETARREAEKSMTEAELRNLKNQLNPHFLLNTLNNIYALIAFSPDKAQQAVHDLSKLLRYVLYDNNQTFVLLGKEVEFMKNYIELMKIRISDNVKIDVNFNIPQNSPTKIAPLLFISLIENAFKHGISYSFPSFINILLEEHENGTIECQIRNSYFPKNENDKSGSGIGLESLQKRLDLLYPNRYTWQKEIKDNIYVSTLVINNG